MIKNPNKNIALLRDYLKNGYLMPTDLNYYKDLKELAALDLLHRDGPKNHSPTAA